MSSRQEEKQRRKEERLAQERAEASAAQRKRLVAIVGGVILAAVVVVAIVLAASGGDDGGAQAGGPVDSPETSVPLPPPREEDLEAAVEAAGCTLEEFENFGQEHTTEELTPENFESNPPTSGAHDPVPAEDGVYRPGNSPPVANWVHTLEHGRIIFMYAPGTPQRRIDQLVTLFNEPVNNGPEGYHTVVMQNNSEMPFEVAAVAWRRFIGCEEFNDRVFDAFRAFRSRFVDQAPELIP